LFFTQHLALLEIAHSALGLVSSPLLTTIIQVASRLVVLDVFTYPSSSCHDKYSLYLMVLSWSCVEIPRYGFYIYQLVQGDKGEAPYFLFFLRYNLFMVLYPSGISGEVLQLMDSFPSYREKNMEWVTRLAKVILILLYLPLGPFMIYNMSNMRSRAYKKRAEGKKGPAPMIGLIWPVTNAKTNDRSTTDTAKKIIAAAARGSKSEKAEDVAKAVDKERNWRFNYPKHIASHVSLCCESSDSCVEVAKAGLESAYSTFKFSVDGKNEVTFAEALKQGASGKKFFSGHCKGNFAGEKVAHSLRVPYKNAVLEGEELMRQCDDWTRNGIIEGSAGEAIKLCTSKAAEWMDLSDVLFVMLGATSAMGPLDSLLAHGANVVAIDLKRPQIWKGLFERVSKSRGTMIYPLDADPSTLKENELSEHAGCDMLKDTLAICDWLDTVLESNSDKQVVCGNYTYLDGALHVQLALAGDAIMSRICKKSRKAALAFLCTPTDDHVIPAEAREAARSAMKSTKFWQKMLQSMGALVPNSNIPIVNNMCIVDGIVDRQGPNYALAKRMQHWRAIVARSEGHVVSSNVAPSTATQSVLSNPQFAAGYYGWRYFSPLEVFMQETSGAVMFALLVNDLRNPLSKANPTVRLLHPLNLFTEQSFHGGIWRCAYTVNSVSIPSAVTYYVETYAAAGAAGLAVIIGAFNYIRTGF